MIRRSSTRTAALLVGVSLAAWAQRPATPPPAARPKAGAAGAPKKAAAPKATAAAPSGLPDSADSILGVKFGPARGLRMPAAEEFTIPGSGLRVLTSANAELPLVNLIVLIPAGSGHDPEGKAGLAEATAAAVRAGGTGALTAQALEERLAELGVTVEGAASESHTQFTLLAGPSSFDAAAGILVDLIRTPRLDPEAIDGVLGRMHNLVSQANQNPMLTLERLFRKRLYAASPLLARTPDYDSLDAISRSDIEGFHQRYYHPARAVAALEGALDAATAKSKATALFANWNPAAPSSGLAAEPATASPPAAPSALLFANRDDMRLSALVMGQTGGRVGDEDFPAMLLVTEVLGANPGGRLRTRVKGAGDFRCDWNASWEPGFGRPGELIVRAALQSAFTTLAITIAREEIAKLREGGIGDVEFETARKTLLTRFALRNESTMEQLRQRALAVLHGLAPGTIPKVYDGLISLSRADADRAAARNLKTEFVTVVAGNAALFDKPLSTIAPRVEPVELTPIAVRAAKPRSDPASLERGRQLLARLQEALGGRDRLAAVRDMSLRQEGSTNVGDRTATVKLWDRWMATGIFRQDQEIGGYAQSVFYDGKIAWIGRRNVVAPLPAAGVSLVRAELFKLHFSLALSDRPERQVADLGGNVLQISEGDRFSVRLYLDPAGLPQRLLYRVDLGNGAVTAVDESYFDWKEFDGIKWPTRIATRKNGRRAEDLKITEAKFNTSLNAADLEKKP